jgi:hypothetical protein
MKKLNYLVLLIPFLLLSCSSDSDSQGPTSYSVQGLWKTTSAVLNGVEIFGGTNPVKSELNYFNADYSFNTNFSTLLSYSTGTYSLPSSSTINISANAYNASNVLIGSYNFPAEVILINATQLHIKVLNYPSANDVYVKKFIR